MRPRGEASPSGNASYTSAARSSSSSAVQQQRSLTRLVGTTSLNTTTMSTTGMSYASPMRMPDPSPGARCRLGFSVP